MNQIFEIVAELRTELADVPAAITFARLPAGRSVSPDVDMPQPVIELLAITDGPRAGVVVLFSGKVLPDMTFYLDGFGAEAAKWFCFGHINDSALFLDRESGAVWWFPGGHEEWRQSDFIQLTDTLDKFLIEYMFGPRYAEITEIEGDRWYEFLKGKRIPK